MGVVQAIMKLSDVAKFHSGAPYLKIDIDQNDPGPRFLCWYENKPVARVWVGEVRLWEALFKGKWRAWAEFWTGRW